MLFDWLRLQVTTYFAKMSNFKFGHFCLNCHLVYCIGVIMQDAADLGLGKEKKGPTTTSLRSARRRGIRPLEIKLLPLGIGPKVHATANSGFRV